MIEFHAKVDKPHFGEARNPPGKVNRCERETGRNVSARTVDCHRRVKLPMLLNATLMFINNSRD